MYKPVQDIPFEKIVAEFMEALPELKFRPFKDKQIYRGYQGEHNRFYVNIHRDQQTIHVRVHEPEHKDLANSILSDYFPKVKVSLMESFWDINGY